MADGRESRAFSDCVLYIASSENGIADALSRTVNLDAEWELDSRWFNEITKFFGYPEIDLFASSLNKKCDKYVSWFPDGTAMAIDAFMRDWRDIQFYAFPPFVLIPKEISKIRQDGAEGILVGPNWPNQPWFPLFCHLIKGEAIILGPDPNLLLSVCRKKQFPGASHLQLIAGQLSHPGFYKKKGPY